MESLRIQELSSIDVEIFVSFIKEYPEYILQKFGVVVKKEDEFVFIQTDRNTIYKVCFHDARFYHSALVKQ
jgi:hypothetical protein